jgi:3-oxoacyl-[acyl-carrier protein] reductase
MVYENLKDKRVLVTGSSSGIGAATAKMFSQQGCYVGVHYFQTKQGGEQTLAEVKKYSDGCLLRADMRDEKQVEEMVGQFARSADRPPGRQGMIDVLVNNAGTLIGRHPIEEATLEFYEDVFATNTRSAFLATRAAIPFIKKSKGNIVNVGSIAGHSGGSIGSGIYGAAKAAVATMTIAMAKEFGKYGVRVNSVLPGLIETRFHEQFSTPERKKKVAQQTPLGRNGTAEDVAKVILFLASDAAEFITGEYIAVNGGLYMRA